MKQCEEFIKEYLKCLKARNYAPSTVQTRRIALSHFNIYLDEKNIDNINSVDKKRAQEFVLYLKTFAIKRNKGKKQKIQDKYLRSKIIMISNFLQYLVKLNKLLFNPLATVELPVPELILPKNVLTKQEMAALLEMPGLNTELGIRNRAILELAYSTGIRGKELVKLQIQDIDFNKYEVFIRKGKPRKDRIVPLGKKAAKYLKLYLENVRPFHQTESKIKNVFLTMYGKPIVSNHLKHYCLTKYLEILGIKKQVTFHTIRHTFATHLLQNGADVRYIKELLGHASIQSTQIYTRVYPEDLIKEVQKFHPGQKKKKK